VGQSIRDITVGSSVANSIAGRTSHGGAGSRHTPAVGGLSSGIEMCVCFLQAKGRPIVLETSKLNFMRGGMKCSATKD
jgi:hypothetical protein